MVHVSDCNIVEYYVGIMMSHESNATWEWKTVLDLDQDYSIIEDCSRIKRANGRRRL
jgi:hypothetical protein